MKLLSIFLLLALPACQHLRGRSVNEQFLTSALLLSEEGKEVGRVSIESGLWSQALPISQDVTEVVFIADNGGRLFNWQLRLWPEKGNVARKLIEGHNARRAIAVSLNTENLPAGSRIELVGWGGSHIDWAAWRLSRFCYIER